MVFGKILFFLAAGNGNGVAFGCQSGQIRDNLGLAQGVGKAVNGEEEDGAH